ncbi:MFS transporter (plasmid) [Paroceanicella profunda]|uniref:MFS transporter n=1 Tax=Paroceanicella profunda TaxID=2579971 RepID=A0A5B8G0L2_9RHOB|nr:MFS transporter [Paroceanicella profunda]QDL94656.1 MFS transporter [Paroceanicella profunda]
MTDQPGLTRRLSLTMATACGLIAANLYYAQPLIGLIAQSLGISIAHAGLIVTMCQAGYGLGLLFLVPLADLTENRRLILGVLGVGIASSVGVALAQTPGIFLFFCLLLGLGSVSVQMLVPLTAHLASDETRGREVGKVMSGLLLGIMLARPASSLITELAGWRTVFVLSAVAMTAMGVALWRRLPVHRPRPGPGYLGLMRSMAGLVAEHPLLRQRALGQALMFASFSVFWTTTPLLLAGPDYGLSQAGIALFAFAGVAGAVAAPLAGGWADRGHGRRGALVAMTLGVASWGLSHVGAPGTALGLGLLALAGIVLDFGVQANLVVSQREIFGLAPHARGRLNGLFMATFFIGGALGSAAGAFVFSHYGWGPTSVLGLAGPAVALLLRLRARDTEPASAPG